MTCYFIIYLFKRELIMKKIGLVGILLFCLLFSSCAKQEKEGYPIEIKKVDNVIYINDPGFPKTTVKEFMLKEELSIGNETDDDYIFSKISALWVDSLGNIYLIEGKNREVRVFDKNGKFLRKFGRKGRGSGEWIYPTYIYLKNNIIYIVDGGNREISRYTLDGQFISDVRVDVNADPGAIFIDSEGNYIVLCSKFERSTYYYKLVKIDTKGKIIKRSEKLLWEKKKYVSSKNGSYIGVPEPFAPSGYIYSNKYTDYIYYGFSDNYEINVFNKDFNKVMVIKKKASPLKILKKDRKNYMKSYMERGEVKNRTDFYKWRKKYIEFPDYHPFFKGMWVDENGNLLVRRLSRDNKANIDVFNKEGVYVEKMIINKPSDGISLDYIFRKPVFKDEYIYTAVEDKNGILLIKKYHIREK